MRSGLPEQLLKEADAGRCVLFIGAGASQESNAPGSTELARRLATQFLDGEHGNDNLERVASLVENKPGVGRTKLIEFIVRELSGLAPSGGHALMKDITWPAVVTTNYDTLIEDSYKSSPELPQPVIVIRSADLVKTNHPRTWGSGHPLIKLRGSISDPFAEGAGLVISEDDLFEAAGRRKGLLSVLEWLQFSRTLVFVGYSFGDYDLNKLWYDIRAELGKLSNWAFATWPGCSEEEVCLWRGRHVELLDCTFSELMRGLSRYVSREKQAIQRNSSPEERTASTEALVSILKNADHYVYDSSVRVAQLARRVGSSLGMSVDEAADLYDAALLKDIGKLSIPDSIKNKPGPLTDLEWQVLITHPTLSAKILEGIPSLSHLADVVLHHHEKVDGSGYPDRLSGEEIPLLARIICACDVLVALLTDRTYRQAFSQERALEILEQTSGVHLDKDVVRILTRFVREDGSAIFGLGGNSRIQGT